MFLKRGAAFAIVIAMGFMVSVTSVEVAETEIPSVVAATHGEVLVGDSGDADPGESLASVFGVARWGLLFLAYLVALTFIDRVGRSRR